MSGKVLTGVSLRFHCSVSGEYCHCYGPHTITRLTIAFGDLPCDAFHFQFGPDIARGDFAAHLTLLANRIKAES